MGGWPGRKRGKRRRERRGGIFRRRVFRRRVFRRGIFRGGWGFLVLRGRRAEAGLRSWPVVFAHLRSPAFLEEEEPTTGFVWFTFRWVFDLYYFRLHRGLPFCFVLACFTKVSYVCSGFLSCSLLCWSDKFVVRAFVLDVPFCIWPRKESRLLQEGSLLIRPLRERKRGKKRLGTE